MEAVRFEPLLATDVDAAAGVTASTLPLPPPGAPRESEAGRLLRLRTRIERARRSDPGGAWVAREDGAVAGLALALRSDGVWVLSLLAVAPDAQSGGLGRGLMERALTHAEGCRGALIASSEDPRAMRLYARAGFDLRPAIAAAGTLDRRALPASGALGVEVHEAGVEQLERTLPIDAAIRGGTRPEHLALQLGIPDTRLYFAGERGYAIGRQGRVMVVAAHDTAAAQALLWRLLADTPADPPGDAIVERITSGQDWAVEVLLRAGLSLRTDGPVFTRGRLGPLTPFLPSGAYL